MHLVTERPREAVLPIIWQNIQRMCRRPRYNLLPGEKEKKFKLQKTNMTFPVVYELIYLGTSVSFLIGSVLFHPTFGHVGVDIGCTLFIVGSAVLALLTSFDLLGDMLSSCGVGKKKEEAASAENNNGRNSLTKSNSNPEMSPAASTRSSPFRKGAVIRPRNDSTASLLGMSVVEYDIMDLNNERLEKLLYLVGAIIFAIGTFQWQHPRTSGKYMFSTEKHAVLGWAITLFIIGSALFVLAAFLNALSLATKQLTFTKWAVVTCTVYELGGILFVIGSVCFMPNQHCGEFMEVLGAWNFILGSFCYCLGGFVEFMKTVALLFLKKEEEEAAEIISRAWRRRSQQNMLRARASQSSQDPSPSDAASGVLSPLTTEPPERDENNSEIWDNNRDTSSPATPAPPEEPAPPAKVVEAEAEAAAKVEKEEEEKAVSAERVSACEPVPEEEPAPSANAVSATPTPEVPQALTASPKSELSTTAEPSSPIKWRLSGLAETCDNCGATFSGDDKFCSRCGAKRRDLTRPLQANCSNCGATFSKDDGFCRKCGNKRLPEPEEPKEEPVKRLSRRMNTETLSHRREKDDDEVVSRSLRRCSSAADKGVPQLNLARLDRHSEMPSARTAAVVAGKEDEARRHTEAPSARPLQRVLSHERHGRRQLPSQLERHPGLVSTFVKALSAVREDPPPDQQQDRGGRGSLTRGRTMTSLRLESNRESNAGHSCPAQYRHKESREEGRPLMDVEMAVTRTSTCRT